MRSLRPIAVPLFLLASFLAAAAGAAPQASVEQLLLAAGNADDVGRLERLQQLAAMESADAQLRADAQQMAAEVKRWLENRNLTYFGRSIKKLEYDFHISPTSPVYPQTHLYRARMLIWYTLESGGINGDRNLRRQFLDKAMAELQKARQAFPQNRIVRMYLGEPTPAARSYPAPASAPPWAVAQREGLERLADVVEWWIDHRQGPDGQYGGGWGDDCEMWRWWVPVLVAFEDAKITAAQARFSKALMELPHMCGGYTSEMTDVEHTAEDSADAITPMMHLAPDDPLWKQRALRLAERMETLWTGRNERGLLQFRSTYFTVDRVDSSPQRACDTVYHPRTVQPALLLWQRTGDPRLTRLFSQWMDTWVDAAARAERGKPAGVLPSAIHWPEGCIGGTAPDWWDPRNHGEAGLYRWPSAMPMMANTLLLTWRMTGKEKYLEPLRSMATLYQSEESSRLDGPETPGSLRWCARQLGVLRGTWAKYRLLSGSNEFDAILGAPQAAGADRGQLALDLERVAAALRINTEGYTSEVRYTDRVLRFPRLFRKDWLAAEERSEIAEPDTGLLYSTATGDPGDSGYLPLAAVRWRTPPREIAALVTHNAPRRLTAELYHFGERPRAMRAELYLLQPGVYTLRVSDPAGQDLGPRQQIKIEGPRSEVTFELPPRRVVVLQVAAE